MANDGSLNSGLATVSISVGSQTQLTVQITGTPAGTPEGTPITLNSSVTNAAPSATLTYAWSVNGGPTAGTGSAFVYTPPDNGNVTITLAVTDGASGSSGSAATTFAVTNVAPTVAITGPSAGVRGEALAFTLSAIDPSLVDQTTGFTFRIDWDGDGSTDQTVTGASGTVVQNTYVNAGTVTASVTAVDKDGGVSAVAAKAVAISAVAVLPDPNYPGTNALFIGGTSAGDNIVISGDATNVQVIFSSPQPVVYQGVGRIVVYGLGGADTITVSATGHAAWVFGGDGNDTITVANGSNNVVVGGVGNDTITAGGTLRNLLIGGVGADVITGGGSDDLLIGGSTAYDADETALAAIMAEWTNQSRDFATRKANLSGTGSGSSFGARLNGNYFFRVTGSADTTTVFDDNAADTLTGGKGQNWIFAS
jgi:hypothetical protein